MAFVVELIMLSAIVLLVVVAVASFVLFVRWALRRRQPHSPGGVHDQTDAGGD